MAAVTVSFDGVRVTNCDASGTGWGTEGTISDTTETDYYYQGSACVSGQVKTAEVGMYYTAGTTANYTTGNFVWLAKIIQTNKDAIDGNGLQLKIGSANSAAYLYEIFSATTYPAVGGWQVIALNPNIAQWRTSTIGSPSLTAVDTYGIRSDAAFQAKAPNLGIDAIDYIASNTGLTLTRGDSTDANGTFSDFVTADEGTQANRWAVVQTRGGIIFVNGTLNIGNSTVNTEFTDSNRVLVFPNHLVSNGFCGINFDISNNSFITLDACVLNGRGSLFTSDDTRPEYIITGDVGQANFTGCTFNTFRTITATSNVLFNGCSFLSGQSMTQNSANVYQCTISGSATAPSSAFILSDNVSRIVDCSFVQGANGGHAIELTTPGTYTIFNAFSGYDANGTSNAAIYNNSSGSVTLNYSAGDEPTITNGSGATTTIVSSATLTITNMYTESEVRVVDTVNNVIVDGVESVNGAVVGLTIANPGSGYTVNDVLTVSGGTGTAATLTVTAVDGGAITAVNITTAGNYTVDPTNPVSVTGGTGAGATFNLDIRGSFAYTYGGAPSYDIVVFHIDYKDVRFVNFAFPSTDSSLLISQIVDRVYFNP